ncbi:hypothetical protein VPH35_132869 [Triticum aestivum]
MPASATAGPPSPASSAAVPTTPSRTTGTAPLSAGSATLVLTESPRVTRRSGRASAPASRRRARPVRGRGLDPGPTAATSAMAACLRSDRFTGRSRVPAGSSRPTAP